MQFKYEKQNTWHVFHEFTNVPAGASVYLQVNTGASDMRVSERITNHTSTNLSISLYESPAVTDGDSALSTFTVNRSKSVQPISKIYTNPSNVSGGTLVYFTRSYGSGTGTFRSVSSEEGSELVLKKNTKYVLQLTNNGASPCNILSNYSFYEV